MAPLRILILGGYGTFGGKLAQLLADESSLTLIIAGRSQQKAVNFCHKLATKATLTPLTFDRNGDVEAQLKAIAPDIAIDATGPFQSYGDDPYRVVKACLALGINCLDFADGSDFVKRIRQFDIEAKVQNVFVLSGVSSFPVLTAAVTRELSQGMQVRSIRAGIAPSPYARVGLNVIRAITGYAGKPVALIRNGRKAVGYAFTETMRFTIAPPGKLPLNNIRFSLVDVPDLQVLPELWPDIDSIWTGVGPVPEILHRMLSGLSHLVRLNIIPSLSPCAPLFHFVINTLRWGEHRGGMFVQVEGITAQGNKLERSWHLVAEGDDGPFIPSMALEGVIRKLLAGNPPKPGARPATEELELADYETLFKNRRIATGFRNMQPMPTDAPLYQRVLNDAWHELPERIQAMHNLKNDMLVSGIAKVDRGKSKLARWLAEWVGFPDEGENIPVSVYFHADKGTEIWKRTFAGKSFLSVQYEGKGRFQGLLTERFGPITIGLALLVEDGKMRLIVRRWTFLGIPLPLALAPTGDFYEFEQDGRFHFHVEMKHPLAGLIVRYQGWLATQ